MRFHSTSYFVLRRPNAWGCIAGEGERRSWICCAVLILLVTCSYLAWFVVLFQNRILMPINIPALNSSKQTHFFFPVCRSHCYSSLLKDVSLNVSIFTFSLPPPLPSTFSWWKRASCSITQLFEEGVTPHKTIENKIPLILLSFHRLLRLFLCSHWPHFFIVVIGWSPPF